MIDWRSTAAGARAAGASERAASVCVCVCVLAMTCMSRQSSRVVPLLSGRAGERRGRGGPVGTGRSGAETARVALLSR